LDRPACDDDDKTEEQKRRNILLTSTCQDENFVCFVPLVSSGLNRKLLPAKQRMVISAQPNIFLYFSLCLRRSSATALRAFSSAAVVAASACSEALRKKLLTALS